MLLFPLSFKHCNCQKAKLCMHLWCRCTSFIVWSPRDLPCVEDVYIAPRNQSYNEAERIINPVLHLLFLRDTHPALRTKVLCLWMLLASSPADVAFVSLFLYYRWGNNDYRCKIPHLTVTWFTFSNRQYRKRSVACLESWITLLLWLVKNHISLYRVYYCIANTVFREC